MRSISAFLLWETVLNDMFELLNFEKYNINNIDNAVFKNKMAVIYAISLFLLISMVTNGVEVTFTLLFTIKRETDSVAASLLKGTLNLSTLKFLSFSEKLNLKFP